MTALAPCRRLLISRSPVGIDWAWVLLAAGSLKADWQFTAWVRFGAVGLLALVTRESWWVDSDSSTLTIVTKSWWREERARLTIASQGEFLVSIRPMTLHTQVLLHALHDKSVAVRFRLKRRSEARRVQATLVTALRSVGGRISPGPPQAFPWAASELETRSAAEAALSVLAWLLIAALLSVHGVGACVLGLLLGLGAWKQGVAMLIARYDTHVAGAVRAGSLRSTEVK